MLVESLQELKRGAGDVLTESENVEQNNKKEDKGDVLILYESNVDGDAEAISDVLPKPRPPNQYVETIVYEEDSDSECSEISETYTKEDLNELCLINSETLDFINNIPSVDTPLCHKQNKIKIKPSGFVTDKHLYFESLYKLNNFNSFGSLLSTSLMDILCSNHKSDNYVCYMDNLISHVQHTIEELKRISNGEYLSEMTKQKWKENTKPTKTTLELNKYENNKLEEADNNKIVSRPLIVSYTGHNEKENIHKALKNIITVRSEINIKLFKQKLGKNVLFKVPKIIGSPVALLNELAKDNFLIQRKTDNHFCRDEISRMIITSDLRYPIFTLSCGNLNIKISTQNMSMDMFSRGNKYFKKTSISENKNNFLVINNEQNENNLTEKEVERINADDEYHKNRENDIDILDYGDDLFPSELTPVVFKDSFGSFLESIATLSTDISIPSSNKLWVKKHSSTSSSMGCSIQKVNSKLYLNIKTGGNLKVKKKPSTTFKIKSPYENSSTELCDRKRKKLLKIKERREKSRNTLPNYKENANQHLKSETIILLTGKSKSVEVKENKQRIKKRKIKRNVNDTQSYMENMKELCSNPTSPIIINNFSNYLELLSGQNDLKIKTNNPTKKTRADSPNENGLNTIVLQEDDEFTKLIRQELYSEKENINHDENVRDQSKFHENVPPVNTPTGNTRESAKSLLSKECKNCIDKLYNLIKEVANPNSLDKEVSKNDYIAENISSGHSGNNNKKKIEIVAHMPKVTLPFQTQKTKCGKTAKNHREDVRQQPENALKAISQLLHKFDNVQRPNKTLKVTKTVKNECETVIEAKKNANEKAREAKSSTQEKIREAKRNISVSSAKSEKLESVEKDNNYNLRKFSISKVKIYSTVETQTVKLPPKSAEMKKENMPKILEGADAKEANEERILRRTRLDVLAQPRKTHLVSNRQCGMSNINPSTGTRASARPQTNRSLIPQRIKSIISTNGTLHKLSDFRNNRFPQANPRTQEETETSRTFNKICSEKKLNISKNSKQTKNTSFHFWKNNVFVRNKCIETNSKLLSPKYKEFKKPQRATISAIAEQDVVLIPNTETKASGNLKDTDKGTTTPVHIFTPARAIDEADDVLNHVEQVNTNTVACLNQSKSDQNISGSDFKIDYFEDGNISTAVANTFARNIIVANSRLLCKKHNFLKFQGRTSRSLTRLGKLSNALVNDKTGYNQSFKDLTPKRSFQQMFVLQSGDAGSLIPTSMLSKDIHLLNIMPKLSVQSLTKGRIDWTYEALSLHYSPALQFSKSYTMKGSIQNSTNNLTRKTAPAENNIDIWNESDIVVSNVGNEKDQGKQEFMKITIQNESVSATKDTEVCTLQITHTLENSISNTDSIHTCRTIDKTTSMDILVELINEIKNISTYHANASRENLKILTERYIKKEGGKIMTFSDIDTLRKIESNSSIHSYFENDKFVVNDNKFAQYDKNEKYKCECLENTFTYKEVCVEEIKVIDCCTDVPSNLLPILSDQSIAEPTSSLHKPTKTHAGNSEKITQETCIENYKLETTETIVDQHLKLKRDILVTVYSFLILTVFVALTYPDIVATT